MLVANVTLGVITTLVVLYMAKEGFRPLWLCAALAGALLVGIFGWRRICRGSGRCGPIALWIGIVVPAIPLFALGTATALGVYYWGIGKRFADAVRIVEYRETAIVWPELGGAVGVRVAIALEVPRSVEGVLYAPAIYETGPEIGAGAPSCSRLPLGTPCLGAPLVPMGPAVPIARGITRLSYDLYPGTIRYFESPRRLCLSEPGALRTAARAATVKWRAALPAGTWVDLGETLTRAATASSSVLDSGALMKLMQRTSHEAFERAGYRHCELHTAFAPRCVCR